MRSVRKCVSIWILLLTTLVPLSGAETFRVATFNLNNYVTSETANRNLRSRESREAVHQSILRIRPDILAVQELGGESELSQLKQALAEAGFAIPNSELVRGHDPDIHVAILSRFPIVARRPHTNDSYLLFGRRFHVSRGFAEVDLQTGPERHVTVMAAHLKSKRAVFAGDEEEMRQKEAGILRRKIDARLKAAPDTPLIVLGDLNDTRDSPALKTILGRGRTALVDTRPAERFFTGSHVGSPAFDLTDVGWTYHFTAADTYSRVDYILINGVLERSLIAEGTFVFGSPDWVLASDHRPVVATFSTD